MFLCFKNPYIGNSKNINLMDKSDSTFFYNETLVISLEILYKEYFDRDVGDSYIERGIRNSNVTYFYEIKSIDDNNTVFYIATNEQPKVYTTSEMTNYE